MKRKLNLALWIGAAVLAAVFVVSSSTKLFIPGLTRQAHVGWHEEAPTVHLGAATASC
jgi:hypothetical protein